MPARPGARLCAGLRIVDFWTLVQVLVNFNRAQARENYGEGGRRAARRGRIGGARDAGSGRGGAVASAAESPFGVGVPANGIAQIEYEQNQKRKQKHE